MLKQIIILLDSSVPSVCHYESNKIESDLIPLETLKAGIIYAMKEDLSIQFIFPSYHLPKEHIALIDTIDHVSVKPLDTADTDTNVAIIDGWSDQLMEFPFNDEVVYIVRLSKNEIFDNVDSLVNIMQKTSRMNVIIKDIQSFNDKDFKKYQHTLEYIVAEFKKSLAQGICPQSNIITDRIFLTNMNNCNAGVETITMAPNGKLYICPAFYHAGECDGTEEYQNDVCQKGYCIGDIFDGLDIKNKQLYQIDHAPICSHCDAFHCKRCVWLNRKSTLEVNTPSHEQCVISHLERNASKQLLEYLQTLTDQFNETKINDVNYLDPFDNRDNWNKM